MTDRGTSNIELCNYANELGLNIEVVMRDNVLNDLNDLDGLIVNLQTSSESGSHWIMMSQKHSVYYDSYGLPPILEAFEYLGHFEFTSVQTQPMETLNKTSAICGQLCLWVLKKLEDDNTFESIIDKLI